MKEFDKILPISEVKENLLSHIKDLATFNQTIAITKNGHPAAVLMSMEDYESLIETLEILSDEKLMKTIRKSLRELDEGKFVTHEKVWNK